MNYPILRTLGFVAGYVSAAIIGGMFVLYTMGQGTSVWLAAGYGIGIALLLALAWHAIIWQVSVSERWYNLVGVGFVSALVFALSMNLTGHAVTTMLAGENVLRREHAKQLPEFETALAEANSNLETQRQIVTRVNAERVNIERLATEEGRTGEGPKFRKNMDHAAALGGLTDDMTRALEVGGAYHADGASALDDARRAMGDAEAFDAAIGRVSTAIRNVNGVDVVPMALNYGFVTTGGTSPVVTQSTRAFWNDVKSLQVAPVEVPHYLSRTGADAVRGGEGAAAEWFKAAIIEGMPLIFVLLLMFGRNDEGVRAKRDVRLASSDEVRISRENLIGMKAAAE